MDRKTVVRRGAQVGLVLLASAAVAALVSGRAMRRAEVADRQARKDRAERLATEDQALLDGMAARIEGLPVDPKVIAEIQTTHYRHRPSRWLYVWGTGNDGQFLFGVPADAFLRLNTVYDQSQQVIAEDNHYATRDQFLRALLHDLRPIAPVKPVAPGAGPESPAAHEGEWWRRYNEERDRRFGGSTLFLSSPIRAATGGIVGNLNLKAVELGQGPREEEVRVDLWRAVLAVSGASAVASLFWLAFLMPSWVYIDAQDRRLPKPLLWALLVVAGNVVGLLVYLISRPDEVPDLRCPQCGKTLNGGKAGCPYCGSDLSAVFCPKCQYPLKPDWSFCPDCRAPLAKGANVPAEPER